MRTLILDGNRFIGSHLIDEVRRRGHDVRVFDRGPERYREPREGVEYPFGDFGNRREISDALEGSLGGVVEVRHSPCRTRLRCQHESP